MVAVVEARDLNKSFGAVSPARNISVAIEEDTVTGLIGTNGAGKTTFVNMVTGYLKPDSGQILLRGHDITMLDPRQITRLGVSRSFQIPQLYDSMSVADNLHRRAGDRAAKQQDVAVRAAHRRARARCAARGGSGPDARALRARRVPRPRRPALLPEGVRKLLDIAMALVVKPKVLMLDEPTSGVSQRREIPRSWTW